ncbi:MAG: hypothetical protein AAGI25_17025 [Bacteroidota bacterium]
MKYLIILSLVLFVACSSNESTFENGKTQDSSMDYFPIKASIEYAKNFSVSYHGNYKVLKAKVDYGTAD